MNNKWSSKVDFIFIFPFCLICLIYGIAILQFGELGNIQFVEREDGIYVNTKLFYHWFFIIGFFIIIITSTMFMETYSHSSLSYFKTLPLLPKDIFLIRYLKLYALIVICTLPTFIIALNQVNSIIAIRADGLGMTQLNNIGLAFPTIPTIVSYIICLNFHMLIANTAMIVFKSRIVSNALIFSYYVLESGPLKGIWGNKAVFWRCFSMVKFNEHSWSHSIFYFVFSICLFVIIYFWFRKKFPSK